MRCLACVGATNANRWTGIGWVAEHSLRFGSNLCPLVVLSSLWVLILPCVKELHCYSPPCFFHPCRWNSAFKFSRPTQREDFQRHIERSFGGGYLRVYRD